MADRTLRASVIIPVFNEEKTIGACLRALTQQTMRASDYEILVIDDGSVDRTRDIAAQFPVRVISQVHQGPAAARNHGAAAAAGHILLFTDGDTEPAPNWVEQMLAPFSCPQVAGAKGIYQTRQRDLIPRFVQIEYEEKYARMASFIRIDLVDTYSAGYRREVILGNGGFDESYPSASVEDSEYSYRLAKLGFEFVFVPGAIVFHQHAHSLAAYMSRKFRIGYWRVRVHLRHPDKAWSDSHTPATQKLQVALIPLVLAAGLGAPFWPVLVFACIALGLCFLLSAIPLTWRAWRRDPQVGILVPCLVLCRAVAQSAGIACGVAGELIRLSPFGRAVVTLYRKTRTAFSIG